MRAAAAERETEQVEADLQAAKTANARLALELAAMQATATQRGAVVSLGDVFFEVDSAELSARGIARAGEIADYIKSVPTSRILIEGHADATGDAAYNLKLSVDRAETLANVLVAYGVNPDAILFTGAGESEPVASNATPLGRQLNRRVDVVFVSRG